MSQFTWHEIHWCGIAILPFTTHTLPEFEENLPNFNYGVFHLAGGFLSVSTTVNWTILGCRLIIKSHRSIKMLHPRNLCFTQVANSVVLAISSSYILDRSDGFLLFSLLVFSALGSLIPVVEVMPLLTSKHTPGYPQIGAE